MPGLILQTTAFVLSQRAATDNFQPFTVFSAEHGLLPVLQRLSRRTGPAVNPLDLFDEADLFLESSSQGRTWFIKESRLIAAGRAIGRSYAALQAASALALVIVKNPVHEDSRQPVADLLRSAFAALATTDRPDVVHLKGLYRFARDEGYPVKQEWFPSLTAPDQAAAAHILNQPLDAQTAPPAEVARLRQQLELYLQGYTEIRLG